MKIKNMSFSNPDSNKFEKLQDLFINYEFELDPLKAYLHHTQELILKLELELDERIKKWDLENYKNPEIPDGFSIHESEIIIKSKFRPLLHRSIFLTVYSLFENEFVRLCDLAGMIQDSKLHPKDLSGNNYIEQCRKYINSVLEVNLDNLQTEWKEIKILQLIRNSFAHNNGILKDISKANIINATPGLILNSRTNEIEIETDEYMMTVINTLVKFLEKTINEIIEQKENSANNIGYS